MADDTTRSITLREGSGRESYTSKTCLLKNDINKLILKKLTAACSFELCLRLARKSHGENWNTLKYTAESPHFNIWGYSLRYTLESSFVKRLKKDLCLNTEASLITDES